MDFTTSCSDKKGEIADLFRSTFTASEGAGEGDLVGTLVERILATVHTDDRLVCSALEEGTLTGAAIFTRMTYPEDERRVYILSPMAVDTAFQGKGIGQKLLFFGLNQLRENGVDVALTYGDINFYSRCGFSQIRENIAQPPLPLTYPEGWLGQALNGGPLVALVGSSTCVEALNIPALW